MVSKRQERHGDLLQGLPVLDDTGLLADPVVEPLSDVVTLLSVPIQSAAFAFLRFVVHVFDQLLANVLSPQYGRNKQIFQVAEVRHRPG